MNNCNRALVPAARQLMAPRRNFFARPSRLGFLDLTKQMEDMERTFARMERDMNAAFKDVGLGRFGAPFRVQSFFEPSSRFLPATEGETVATEKDGNGKYLVKMNLGSAFNPDDVKVSLRDRVLTIDAKFEKKSDDGNSRVYQEISRSFTLPDNIKLEEVKSLFTPEGELIIEAPLHEIEAPKPKEIPIAVESK